MDVDLQLKLFEPVYLLKESALRKLRLFDLDGAQEDLNRILITEPKNPFASASVVALNNFRKELFITAKGNSTLQQALALHRAWEAFKSEAEARLSVDSLLLSSLRGGVWQQLIELLEASPEDEVVSLYPELSLGHFKLEAGAHHGAARALEKLLAYHGPDPKILVALANAYYHLGQYHEADETYLKAFFIDVDAAFREGVENKILTLSLESFFAEGSELCWFPLYAILKGAVRLSTSLLQSEPWAASLLPLIKEEAQLEEIWGEQDRARLFYICLASAEGGKEPGEGMPPELLTRMKELNPVAFQWYLNYEGQKDKSPP